MSWSDTRGTVRPFRSAGGGTAQPIDALLNQVIQQTTYDQEFAMAMAKRDETLIAEEVLHGALHSGYIYNFKGAGGAQMTGISVVGARELAYHYGGLHHKVLGVTRKQGSMFTFESYDPLNITVQSVESLKDEPDYVAVRIRVIDTKKDNSIEITHQELLKERRNQEWLSRNPGADEFFPRPHAQTIAASKAYRNAIRSLVPQHVQIEWLKLVKEIPQGQTDLTQDVLGEKRAAVIRYAASKGLSLDRQQVERLTLDQISGLSDAAREGNLPQFNAACQGLGLFSFTRAREVEPPKPATTTRRPQQRQQAPQGDREAPTAEERRQPPQQEAHAQQEQERQEQADVAQSDQNADDGPFEVHLLDHVGEPMVEVDRDTGEERQAVIRDPVDYANWMAGYLPMSSNPVALWENNADNNAAAAAASLEAAKILHDAHQRMLAEDAERAKKQAAADEEQKATAAKQQTQSDKDMLFATRDFIPEFDKVTTIEGYNELISNTVFKRFVERMQKESVSLIYPLVTLAMVKAKERVEAAKE